MNDKKNESKILITTTQLAELVSEISNKPNNSISRHPLTLLIFGFIFTSVFGVLIADYLQKLRIEEANSLAKTMAASQAGMDSTIELSKLLYERRTRAELLAAALKSNSDKKLIEDRKVHYDQSYVEWNSRWPGLALKIRDGAGYSEIESYIQFAIMPEFKQLDTYLTEGYTEFMKNSSTWKYDSSYVRPRLKKILDCSYVITEHIWVNSKFFGQDTKEFNSSLSKRCPRK
ncbi:hypothetical protein AMEC673_09105 [Alteromonas macleodii str. 'English Channel 673']|uniref:Uncharacterized protein n=1 Tax=Alteromonas macleodii (strain English Channel 673) TaxID=1004788 RepID=A0AB32ZY33_ALTME|nr:hypothetical protein [Alteromonas macleodii]AFT74515.1 hypothetical protein AMEC673_09105 [Alteromonas macleodii str. 'English Channel 673']